MSSGASKKNQDDYLPPKKIHRKDPMADSKESDFESSIFDASDGHKLVDLIRKKKGLHVQSQKIFDDIPARRPSLHIEFQQINEESDTTSSKQQQQKQPQSSDAPIASAPTVNYGTASGTNFERTNGLPPIGTKFVPKSPRRTFLAEHISSPRNTANSINLKRRTLLREFDKAFLQESRFLPEVYSTPITLNVGNPTNHPIDNTLVANEPIKTEPIDISSNEDMSPATNTEQILRSLIDKEKILNAIQLVSNSASKEISHGSKENPPQQNSPCRTYTVECDITSGQITLSPAKSVHQQQSTKRTPLKNQQSPHTRKLFATPEQRKVLLSRLGAGLAAAKNQNSSCDKLPKRPTSTQIATHISNTASDTPDAAATNENVAILTNNQETTSGTAQFVEHLQKNVRPNCPVIVIPVNQTFNQAAQPSINTTAAPTTTQTKQHSQLAATFSPDKITTFTNIERTPKKRKQPSSVGPPSNEISSTTESNQQPILSLRWKDIITEDSSSSDDITPKKQRDQIRKRSLTKTQKQKQNKQSSIRQEKKNLSLSYKCLDLRTRRSKPINQSHQVVNEQVSHGNSDTTPSPVLRSRKEKEQSGRLRDSLQDNDKNLENHRLERAHIDKEQHHGKDITSSSPLSRSRRGDVSRFEEQLQSLRATIRGKDQDLENHLFENPQIDSEEQHYTSPPRISRSRKGDESKVDGRLERRTHAADANDKDLQSHRLQDSQINSKQQPIEHNISPPLVSRSRKEDLPKADGCLENRKTTIDKESHHQGKSQIDGEQQHNKKRTSSPRVLQSQRGDASKNDTQLQTLGVTVQWNANNLESCSLDFVQPPDEFRDSTRSFSIQEDLVGELSSDRVVLSQQAFKIPTVGKVKKKRKAKTPEHVHEYLQVEKKLSRTNILNASKRKLYCSTITSDIEEPDESTASKSALSYHRKSGKSFAEPAVVKDARKERLSNSSKSSKRMDVDTPSENESRVSRSRKTKDKRLSSSRSSNNENFQAISKNNKSSKTKDASTKNNSHSSKQNVQKVNKKAQQSSRLQQLPSSSDDSSSEDENEKNRKEKTKNLAGEDDGKKKNTSVRQSRSRVIRDESSDIGENTETSSKSKTVPQLENDLLNNAPAATTNTVENEPVIVNPPPVAKSRPRKDKKKKEKNNVDDYKPNGTNNHVSQQHESGPRRSKRERKEPTAYWACPNSGYTHVYDIVSMLYKGKKPYFPEYLLQPKTKAKPPPTNPSSDNDLVANTNAIDSGSSKKQSNKSKKQQTITTTGKQKSKAPSKTKQNKINQATESEDQQPQDSELPTLPEPSVVQSPQTDSTTKSTEQKTTKRPVPRSKKNSKQAQQENKQQSKHTDKLCSSDYPSDSSLSVENLPLTTITEQNEPTTYNTESSDNTPSHRKSSTLMPPPKTNVILKPVKSITKKKNKFQKEHDESIAVASSVEVNKLFDQLKNTSISLQNNSRLEITNSIGQVSQGNQSKSNKSRSIRTRLRNDPSSSSPSSSASEISGLKNLRSTNKENEIQYNNTTNERHGDSGFSSDMNSINPKKDMLLQWLVQILNNAKPSLNNNQKGLARFLKTRDGYNTANVDELTFEEIDGVDFAFYNTPGHKFGYLRFKPHTEKKMTCAKRHELNFVLLAGTIQMTVDKETFEMNNGDLTTIFIGTKYRMKNSTDEPALAMVIKN